MQTEISLIVALLHQPHARSRRRYANQLPFAVEHDLSGSATQARIHIGVGCDHLQALCFGLLFDRVRPVHCQVVALDVRLGEFAEAASHLLGGILVAGCGTNEWTGKC